MIRGARRIFISASLAGPALAGCSRSKPSLATVADSLPLAHGVELQQSDSNFVARPFRMSIRSDNSVMISDIGQARIWWFGPLGGIVRQDTVWFGAMVIHRGTAPGSISGVGSLVRWPIQDSVASTQWVAPDGLSRDGGATPLGALASQMISVDSAGFWVKYGLRDVLERRARDGTLEGEWQIPVERRRGVPQARIAFALNRDNWTTSELANPNWTELNFSGDRSFGQRRDGTLLLITVDGVIDGKVLLGNFYASLLDPIHDRACVDWVLPTRSVAMPLTAVVGDSVALLSQEIDSASTSRVRLMLRYFTLPTDECHWQPMPKALPASL